MGIPREKLVVVSIMPCLAKKYECDRDEFKVNGVPDVDYSISTRELARLIKRANIGFTLVLDSPFDNPMGESTAPVSSSVRRVVSWKPPCAPFMKSTPDSR